MSAKRIALDLDGVVYNYSATACFLLNKYKSYNLDWTETNSWDWLQQQVSNNDWQWLWSGGIKEGLFRYGSLLKGAAEGVKELSKIGSLCVVTSRPSTAINDTLEWLAFMKFPVTELHILSHGQNKAKIQGIDVAIDDGPKNVKDYLEANIDTIMYTHKYNQHLVNETKVIPAYNWDEVVAYTKELCGVKG